MYHKTIGSKQELMFLRELFESSCVKKDLPEKKSHFCSLFIYLAVNKLITCKTQYLFSSK